MRKKQILTESQMEYFHKRYSELKDIVKDFQHDLGDKGDKLINEIIWLIASDDAVKHKIISN
jgi:hypothetical protein